MHESARMHATNRFLDFSLASERARQQASYPRLSPKVRPLNPRLALGEGRDDIKAYNVRVGITFGLSQVPTLLINDLTLHQIENDLNYLLALLS